MSPFSALFGFRILLVRIRDLSNFNTDDYILFSDFGGMGICVVELLVGENQLMQSTSASSFWDL